MKFWNVLRSLIMLSVITLINAGCESEDTSSTITSAVDVPTGTPIQAQTYSCTQDSLVINVYINTDGSAAIEYYLTFTTDSDSDSIYSVDIDMPNPTYMLTSAEAEVDGIRVDIGNSPNGDPGIVVKMGEKQISAGQTSTVHLRVNVREMVHPSSEAVSYAGLQFYSNYFDPGLVHGTTDMTVNIYFPPGVQPEEARYYEEFTSATTEGDLIVYTWKNPSASPNKQYKYGVYFPSYYVDTVYQPPTPEPAARIAPTGQSLGDTWIRPVDGMVMVFVPGGEFQIGSTEDEVQAAQGLVNDSGTIHFFENEKPMHSIRLEGFWIDQTEVTNKQYALCVEAGACEPPRDSSSDTRDTYYGDNLYDDYPVIYVNWSQAAVYCAWTGARLPTEAEWEVAARGPERQLFPWGDVFDGARLNYCDVNCEYNWADEEFDDGYVDTAPVGSYPSDGSWCNVLDMGGNVQEWVADWYGDYPSIQQVNPTGPPYGEYRVVRGGSWYLGPEATRCAYRVGDLPSGMTGDNGFRCASDSK